MFINKFILLFYFGFQTNGSIFEETTFFFTPPVMIWLGVEKFLFGGPKTDRFEKIKCFWDIETATLTTQKRIDERLRLNFSKYNFGMIWSSTLATFSLFAWFFSESFLYPEKMYVQKIFASSPKIAFVLECFVVISHAVWVTLTPAMILFIKYGVLTINIQLNLLTDFLNQIEIYDFSDDINIGKHLKICCTQHILICR
ncbi:hypothetical protein WA026_013042 [Henosepilachna vigintioctopunctata]|uniref:7tm 6 domain containing protein n=1 Tax=Henosepilachna vigintioctopunctata TaxID=420089 RepID=A0AAW1UJ47_9CUCU